MANCKNCGKEIADDLVVCDECAAKLVTPAAPEVCAEEPKPMHQENGEDLSCKPVGVFTYIGLFILFAIPIIGFISAIIFAFAPKSKSLKNYARAVLIRMVVVTLIAGLIISAVISILGNLLEGEIGFNINDLPKLSVGEMSTAVALMNSLQNEDMAAVADIAKSGKLDSILEKAEQGEFDDIITSMAGDDARELLNSIKSGELRAELEKFKNGEYDEYINEYISGPGNAYAGAYGLAA